MQTDNELSAREKDAIALEVAIGKEVSDLLNLKFDKSGKTKTSWGTKSIKGLGACIIRIMEEQKNRLK